MERKEFSSVAEAIEALNSIKNIDYSSVDGVSELTEREFYNNLMNNFMGTRNLKFTAEERENYKAALKKKGLLTYREWKDRQPQNLDGKVTWNDSVERGTLDAPVNIFSKLIEEGYEEKFEYIREVVNKTVLGRDWVKNNDKIVKEIKEKQVEEAIQQTIYENEQEMAKEVQDMIKEKEEQNVQQIVSENEHEMAEVEQNMVKESEVSDSNTEKELKFSTPEEAIEALKSIEKFDYKEKQNIGGIKEKEFYAKVMKNFIACSDLKFTPDDTYEYRKALESIGGLKNGTLKGYRDGQDEKIKVPQNVVHTILDSQNGAKAYTKFEDMKSKARNNEELNNWLEEAQKEIENVEKDQIESQAIVPYKKPSLFKKIRTYATIAAASIATLFGGKKLKDNTELANEAIDKNTKLESEAEIDDTKENEFFSKVGAKDFSEKLRDEVHDEAKLDQKEIIQPVEYADEEVKDNRTHRKGDQNYMKTPEDNAEKTGEANERAEQEKQKAKEEAKIVEKAQEEASKENIEIVIENDIEEKEEEKKEEKNESVIVGVGDNGSINKNDETPTPEQSKPSQSSTPSKDPVVEDSREEITIDVGFDSPQTYSEVEESFSEVETNTLGENVSVFSYSDVAEEMPEYLSLEDEDIIELDEEEKEKAAEDDAPSL